jgi:pectate lyase
MFKAILLCQSAICLATESPDPNSSTKYLNAVREFGNNVLKYGRDTYGPKRTPLFVDGLMVRDPKDPNYGKDGVFKPVEWIDPDGTRWILSNLASQQNLFRTLDALTTITGDPKYRQAAMEAIEYAFENLRHPNGLFYWGHTTAYDAGADDIRSGTFIARGGSHALKLDYPYYELMWQVDPNETKKFIEAFWSAHVIDWSNLDFDRYALFDDALEEPWNHEYKRYPTFFKSKKPDSAAGTWTGTSLIHGGTTLYRLSREKQPLIWSKRLAERFIDTRHPKTGISYESYTYRLHQLGDDLKEHFDDPYTRHFPQECFDIDLCYYYGENVTIYAWMSMLLVGDMLGEKGKEFRRWALEEFTAMGKASYRKKDNSLVPILTDGTRLEGYVWKEAPGTGSEGMVIKPLPADMPFFWGYSVAYRITGDEFMWEMVRDIALGNNFGDIGQTSAHIPELQTGTSCSDVYGLLGFVQLYEKTNKPEYLNMARCIGDNILLHKFHSGFFVPSKKHIYGRFDCLESLALLHLDEAMKHKTGSVPRVWPSVPLFVPPYRYKEQGIDRLLIYTLTESSEPPLSLQEAAAIGDVNLVRTLIENGTGVDSLDDSSLHTALHRAATRAHKDVVEMLIAEGAYVNARTPGFTTPLHYAAQRGRTEIAELLIDKGADVNAKNNTGQTPLDIAVRRNHKGIVDLLRKHGAKEDKAPESAPKEKRPSDPNAVEVGESDDIDTLGKARQSWLGTPEPRQPLDGLRNLGTQ